MAPCPVRTRPAQFLSLIFLAFALAASGCGDEIPGKAKSVAALAGASGGPGYFDGSPSDPVRFDSPSGVAVVGTDRFVTDTKNHVIRKIDAAGNVTTFAGAFGVAGSADGTGAAARFDSPSGITAVGTLLFICDTGNHTIREVVSTSGVVTTLAGSPGIPGSADNTTGANARFRGPRGIAVSGSTLYVADTGNHQIRAVTLAGSTSTFAGSGVPGSSNGLGAAAQFSFPEGIAVVGTTLVYVADTGNHTMRRLDVAGSFGNATTLAGTAGAPGAEDNTGGLARFRSPAGMATDGLSLFVCDRGNHVVRNVTQSGVVTTLAGSLVPPPGTPTSGFADGTGSAALFSSPSGIGTLGGGSSVFFVADTENHVVRQLTNAGVVTTVAGTPPRFGGTDGAGAAARFDGPAGITVIGDNVFLADAGNHTIRKITSAGTVSTFAGLAGVSGSSDSPPRFNGPAGIAAVGTDLYVADTGNHTIRKITAAGTVSTFAGLAGVSGSSDSPPRFNGPMGIAAVGTDLYVADTGNHTIRKITAAGTVSLVAGLAGTSGATDIPTRFQHPEGIAATGTSTLYVADTGNHSIRRIAIPSGSTDTFAGVLGAAGFTDGQGSAARFTSPAGIGAVDSILYVADRGNHVVRRISTTRSVTTFAGNPGAATTINGDPSAARMNAPTGIAGVPGTIYFTDANENVLRKILY